MPQASIRPARAARNRGWVALLFLGVAVLCPVGFVVWLVREAVATEQAMVAQLWRETEQRELEDAGEAMTQGLRAYLIDAYDELIEREMGVAELLPLALEKAWADSIVVWEGEEAASSTLTLDTAAARAMMAEGRSLLGLDSASAANWEELEAWFVDEDRIKLRFGDGRNPLALLCRLTLVIEGTDTFMKELSRRVLLDYSRYSMPASQRLNFLEAWHAKYPGDAEINRIGDAERLAWRWRQDTPTPPESLVWAKASGIGLIDADRKFAMIFSPEHFLALGRSILQRHVKRFAIELRQVKAADESVSTDRILRLQEGMDFLELALMGNEDAPPAGAGRAFLYLAIGSVVLALSATSGAAIFLFMRRQNAAAQLKNDLVATVTHELKTPVSSIRLLVDSLLDDRQGERFDQREYLQMISRENQRLGHLIDNFLSFSRMERSKSSFTMERVDPAAMARQAEQMFRERFKDKVFDLSVQVEDGLKSVWGDREALQSAVANLLENAFKYGCVRRRITFKVRSALAGVCFEVEDFGRGVARKDRQRIFDRFYQADRGDHEQSAGVGLGLSIVAFIVEAHGGEIGLRSEIGQGSVFSITIPYAKDTNSRR